MIREVRNCNLFGDRNTTIRIKEDKIHSITKETGWEPFIDVHNMDVFPGVIDVHVHDRTPGDQISENWHALQQAAIRGGVVALAKMPNTNPAITTLESFHKSCEQVGSTLIPYKVWFGATTENHNEIRQAAKENRVCGVKMYMGSSTGNLLIAEPTQQQRIFEICAEENLTLAVHPEDENMMLENRRLLGRQPLLTDHCIIRSTPVEVSAVQRALDFAFRTNCRLHLCHISTPESVELARDAKDQGVNVTVGVCPHHFMCDATLLAGPNPGFFKMNPPLRTRRQKNRLQQLVARPGYVDVIESDHAPHSLMSKQNTTYDTCPSGVPGIEHILPISLQMMLEQEALPEYISRLLSGNPARLLGLESKGYIKVGYDADIICCNQKTFEITAEKSAHACGWTPYEGVSVYGQPHLVLIGGKVILNKE